MLSGAEDLVPVLDNTGNRTPLPLRTVQGIAYEVDLYRPRIEGLFARIERWTRVSDRDTHWRSISRDNITTLYGKRDDARIADPGDATHIFSWLICESYDDKGNAIFYRYKPEDDANVDASAPFEQSRLGPTQSPQRYLKRIQYGNPTPHQLEEDFALRTDWLFEVVLDYGEHDSVAPSTKELQQWLLRQDPFFQFRATFDIRNYRLCRRILMFHHFLSELGGTSDYLVKSTDFEYREGSVASFIASITQAGYVQQPDKSYLRKALPKLAFQYTDVNVDETVHEIGEDSIRNLPYGVDGARYQWVDLESEGLIGVLTEQADAWYYKRNLGNATFGAAELVAPRSVPSSLAGGQQLLDLAGEGHLELVQFDGPMAGFNERRGWRLETVYQIPVHSEHHHEKSESAVRGCHG